MSNTNDIQTPLGTGVQAALALTAGTAGGVTLSAVDPGISYTGTIYGSLATVWTANCVIGGTYSGPYLVANIDNTITAGTLGSGFSAITTLNLGGIQVINNGFNGTLALLTSFVASDLIQCNSDFRMTAATLTTLTLTNLANVGGDFGGSYAVLTSLSAANLIAINGTLTLTASTLLTSVNLSVLTYIGGTAVISLTTVTTLNLASLQYVGSSAAITAAALINFSLPAIITLNSTFQITAANLVTFSFGSTLLKVGGNVTITNAKLDVTSVNSILVSLAALDGTGGTTAYSSKTVNLSGGTSATPTGAGATAKTTLIGRGCTVTTN